MKRVVYAVLATLSGLVLLFSYRTSLDAVDPMAATEPVASSGTVSSDAGATAPATGGTSDDESQEGDDESDDNDAGSGSESGSTSTQSGGSTSSTASGLVDGTYTGASADTRYGPVQVQISVSGGAITDVQVLDYPASNSKDRQINERALPVLISETTQTQSAQIDMVSGATYTSQGYITSLQSAIDQAQS